MNKKNFYIVSFIHEKQGETRKIDLVPQEWIHVGKETKQLFTYYQPPESDGTYFMEDLILIKDLCKNRVRAPDSWKSYEIEILGWAGKLVSNVLFQIFSIEKLFPSKI